MKHEASRGVSISLVNLFFTILTAIVFCFILIISNNVKKRFDAVNEALDKFIICQQSSAKIREAADYLTDQARLFVVTHKHEYADAYIKELQETKRQEQAMEALESVCSKSDLALQRLKIALEQAQGLMDMEKYAMRLAFEVIGNVKMPEQIADIPIADKDRGDNKAKLQETAVNNLFGDGYLIYKMRINVNCQLTVAAI